MRVDGLTNDERELLMLFILGAVLGLLAAWIVEEWVIAADLGDRQRIRDELERWLAELPRGRDLEPQAAELPQGEPLPVVLAAKK
jgi:hypothetical protein